MKDVTGDAKRKEDRFWKFFLIFIMVASVSAAVFFVIESLVVEERARKEKVHTLFSEPADLLWNDGELVDKELQSLINFPIILGENRNRAWEDWSTNTILQKLVEVTRSGYPIFKISHLSVYAELYLRNVYGFERKNFEALEFSVIGEVKNKESLLIELIDKEGRGLGVQSLLWYAPSEPILGGEIHIVIPLKNLNAGEKIYGIRIARSEPGEILISDMRFTDNQLQYPLSRSQLIIDSQKDMSVRDMFPQYTIKTIERYDDALNWKVIYGGNLITKDFKLNGLSLGNLETMLALFVSGFEWRNYRFDLVLNWPEIQGVSLFSRYKDENNNAKCAFGGNGGYVAIYETVGGREEIKSYTYTNTSIFDAWKDVSIGIEAVGNELKCRKDGEVVLKYVSLNVEDSGTVGIGLWNSAGGGGIGNKIEIIKLSIEEI